MATFPTISSTLSPGMSSPEVRKLQQILNALGFSVASAGQPGGPGSETDYFGPATQAALQKFQAAQGIVSSGSPTSTGYGNLGPMTLAALNSQRPSSTPTASGSSAPGSPPPVNPKTIGKRYGYQVNRAAENRAVAALDGFMNVLSSGAAGDIEISSKDLKKIMNDDKLVGFYVNALAYGGYTLQDVYMDMMREGMGSRGADIEPISAYLEAPAYKASKEYDDVEKSSLSRDISATVAGLDSFVTTMPVLQMPDEAFNQLRPVLDPNSPEFREEMEKYKSATYEIALEIAEAQNEVEHTKALAMWDNLRKEISGRLNITLSNNAAQAWAQIQGFQTQASENGIAGSGIEAREVDNYLRNQVRTNNNAREYYSEQTDKEKMSYYQNFASPDEIAKLDPALRKAWGLMTEQETIDYLDIKNLRKLFPDTPESDLMDIRNKYIDPNGNLMSTLYSKYAGAKYDTKQNYNVDKATKVILKEQNDAAKDLKKFSNPNDLFLEPEGKMDTKQRALRPEDKGPLVKEPVKAPKAPKPVTPTPKPVIAPAPAPKQNSYTIKYGDTLSAIALRNKTSISDIMKKNPGITDANKIKAGQSIYY